MRDPRRVVDLTAATGRLPDVLPDTLCDPLPSAGPARLVGDHPRLRRQIRRNCLAQSDDTVVDQFFAWI